LSYEINKHLTIFWKIISEIIFQKLTLKTLGTPGAVHPRRHRETDRRARGQRGPHPSDAHPWGGLNRSGSRRRQGPHHHTLLREADLVDPLMRLRRQRSELAIANGGTVVRLNGGRLSPAKRRHGEWRTSTGELRRTRCTQGEGKRGSGGEESTERSSPVSLVVLRRAIPVEGSLTTGSQGKRGLREREAVLRARWRR
jgi:hypothetical protein